jgi:dTMP kinase
LAARLQDQGRDVVVTREPGGVPTAEAIRSLLLDTRSAGLDPRAEALLFAAARAEHVARLIRPAMARGTVVICDRFTDSSVAYQGVGRGLGVRRIAELSAWATDGLHPDATVVLDVDPSLGLVRAGRGQTPLDRMESEPAQFHNQVRRAFLDRAAADPDRYLVIDAAGGRRQIAARIADYIDSLLMRHEQSQEGT